MLKVNSNKTNLLANISLLSSMENSLERPADTVLVRVFAHLCHSSFYFLLSLNLPRHTLHKADQAAGARKYDIKVYFM